MNSKRIIILYFLLCHLAILAVLLLSPLPETYPEARKITFCDKAIHFALFGIFSYILMIFLLSFEKIKFSVAGIIALFLSSGLNYLAEYLQAFVPGRSVSSLDFLAGLLGSLCALAVVYAFSGENKSRILLHVCCATCAAYVQEKLKNDFQVISFYYNPNIYPEKEFKKRLEDVIKLSKKNRVKLIVGEYAHKYWKGKVKGNENDIEGGERCRLCLKERLEETARKARELHIPYFASTLSVSPHKDIKMINKLGIDAGRKYGVEFLPENFKKKDGFKKSLELSKNYNFYRQNYCGCEFSIKK